LEDLKAEGFSPYPNTFRLSHSVEEINRLYGDKSEESFKDLEERFSVAGRLIRLNNFGKAAFGHIHDRK
jgi:lysyl-tRNA synthetase class II